MVSEAPPFWWQAPGIQSSLLSPFAWLYGRVARRILDHRVRKQVPVPVICVGNFTVGGSGKTPTALALAEAAIARSLTPGFLSRGYGGGVRDATIVDPSMDTARLVGDEPMLLAAKALTVVSANRVAGAELLVREGADLIIMDDGFQSARLVFDQALLVVDARRGIGNGRVFPAGPVRAPVIDQVRHADALIVVGEGEGADPMIRLAARAAKPITTGAPCARSTGRKVQGSANSLPGLPPPTRRSRKFPSRHTLRGRRAVPWSAQRRGYFRTTIISTSDRDRGPSGRRPELYGPRSEHSPPQRDYVRLAGGPGPGAGTWAPPRRLPLST